MIDFLPKNATFIDAGPGEATIIRDALMSTFDLDKETFSLRLDDERCKYPSLAGNKSLVKLLEDKYQAPVIITNGAKQGLSASFFACNRLGITAYGMRTPYWEALIPLAKHHGLKFVETEYDAYLLVMPNNPDGFTLDYNYIQYLTQYHKSLNIPVIHDSVYYNHIYLPDTYKLGPLGDVQIFSLSKSCGLSSMRLGYCVCYNQEFYDHILNYIELTTVGVSTFSQGFAYELLREMELSPIKTKQFETKAKDAIYQNKLIMKTVNKDVLELPIDFENSIGLFAWARVGASCDFDKAKVFVCDGAAFGCPGFARINLGIRSDVLKEVVNRLNGSV